MRQNDLVVCKLADQGHWFWTACYKGTVQLIGRTLEPNEEIEVNLEVTNMLKPFNSNKTQIGVLSAWGLVLFSFLAVKFLSITVSELSVVLPCVTAVIVSHVLGYAITDASVHFGKGKAK